MKQFGNFYSTIENRKFNTWCKYTTRLDTYGCGCQHDCSYCYAKSLLNFRGLWDSSNPSVPNIDHVHRTIRKIPRHKVIKIGGMTDPFQPLEKEQGITYETIKLFNRYKINYLIVTKSSLVADDKYLDIYDKELAHFQITITNTDDYKCLLYEKASKVSDRIKAIEKLHSLGFDVSVRLSPFIYGFIDFKVLNDIDCDKILVEYLKVNHWIKKWFNIDYDSYSLKYGGYLHLQLSDKKEQLESIDNFGQLSVGEYVKDHHSYFSENVNYNSDDCCNLSFVNMRKPEEQINLFSEVNYEN